MKENVKAPLVIGGMPLYIIAMTDANGEILLEETYSWGFDPETLISKTAEHHKPDLRWDARYKTLRKVTAVTCYAVDEDCDRTEEWTLAGDEFRKLLTD